jgi:hypothetical protein
MTPVPLAITGLELAMTGVSPGIIHVALAIDHAELPDRRRAGSVNSRSKS